jgi:hypothetical protein
MKNHAQAILLTGHPLEPIVALQINKSLQAQVSLHYVNTTPAQTNKSVYTSENKTTRRFSNYR